MQTAFAQSTELHIAKSFRFLTPKESQGMAIIRAYSFDEVREKILNNQSISESEVDLAIEEFKKYLSLICLGYRGIAMASKDVDEVWHTFILFTKKYESFCNQVFGAFLHHEPSTRNCPVPVSASQKFVNAYHEVFGPIPKIWSGVAQGVGECRSCSDTCSDGCSGSTNCQDSE